METTTTPKLPAIFSPGFFKLYFKGASQVMFQENTWTGILFMAGIFYGAFEAGMPAIAWGAVIGTFTSTLTGYLLKYPAEKGIQGLWGFNGILTGCALPAFLDHVPLMWLTVIIFSAMTTWVMAGLNMLWAPTKVSTLTFPFVLTTWIVLMAARTMHGLPDSDLGTPELPGNFSALPDTSFKSLVIYWLKGISQVFLINSWVTGLLFLAGLFISNRWAAVWAAIASAASLAIAILFQCNGKDIADGLFGYSAVLTGIALGTTFYKVNRRTALWALTGIFATVFVQAGMNTFLAPIGIPALTGPFCVTTWLFLWPRLNLEKTTSNV